MATIILYKDKRLGRALKYDFKSRTFELLDYKSKKVKSVNLIEFIKIVDEKGKERLFNFQDAETYLNVKTTISEREYSLEKILKNISKLNPQIKTDGAITPLNAKGLESLVEKELRKKLSTTRQNYNPNIDLKKLKYVITCELLIDLEKRYYTNDDIPSILSVKRIVQELIEKHYDVDEEEIDV